MRHAIAFGLAAIFLAACQPSPEPQIRLKRPQRTQSTGVSPSEAQAAGWVPSGSQPAPRASSTPTPDGYATPLPRSAFPADTTGTTTTTSSTPVPEVQVSALQPAVVITNSLPSGRGSIGGIVIDVPSGMKPVGEATILIALETDRNQQATLRNAGDGTYQITGLAYGTYLVWASKSGYVGDTAPIVVTLSTSSSAPGGVNMVLVKP